MEPVATFPLTSTTDLRALFNANTLRARQALRKVVVGKLLLEPVTVSGRSCYKISGQLALRRLLPADLAQSQNRRPVVAPTGFSSGVTDGESSDSEDFRLPFRGAAQLGAGPA